MKRIVYLTHRFPVVTESFTTAEVDGLAARGIELTVLPMRGHGAAAEAGSQLRSPHASPSPAGVARTLPFLLAHPRRRALAAWRGAALAAAIDPARDHIHAQFPLGASSAGLLASRATGAGFSFAGHTYHRLDRMPQKLATARFVVVGSEFERTLLLERYGARWDSKIRIRRLGVPERENGQQFEPNCVVSVGTLTPKKGHDILLRAVAQLPAARLEIVGEGPARGALEQLAAELALGDRVRFLGTMPYAEMLTRVARAHAFALCCRATSDGDHDCLPVALMDAMSLAVPCVSSQAFGIPELIEDGVSGLLGRAGDAGEAAERIALVLADERLRGELGVAGREAVRGRYRLEANLDALAELFRDEAL